MAKAVLVMDMPEDCPHCPCPDWIDKSGHHIVCRFDSPLFRSVIGYDGKPGWCPLISEPKRKKDYIDEDTMVYPESYCIGYCTGFNACLDELEGNNETD